MNAKRRGLGRGLDALLSATTATENETDSQQAQLLELPLDQLTRGRYQPRRDMEPEALEELASSIKAQGIMQPIIIRPTGHQQYEIIAGERRWRAARMVGLKTVPVVVKDVGDDAAIAMALIENIQRENLNAIEEAVALQRLQEEFELSQQEVANAVGKSRTAVANLLRLLNLTDEVKRMLEYGDIEMGHARALLAFDKTLQLEIAKEIINRGLSVRQAEQIVRNAKNPSETKEKSKLPLYQVQVEKQLSELLSTPVTLTENAKGKGKITISYANVEALQAIVRQLSSKE